MNSVFSVKKVIKDALNACLDNFGTLFFRALQMYFYLVLLIAPFAFFFARPLFKEIFLDLLSQSVGLLVQQSYFFVISISIFNIKKLHGAHCIIKKFHRLDFKIFLLVLLDYLFCFLVLWYLDIFYLFLESIFQFVLGMLLQYLRQKICLSWIHYEKAGS